MKYLLNEIFAKSKAVINNLIFKEDYRVFKKKDNTLVSSIDLLIQEELISIIEDFYPNHNILFEEGELKHIDKKSSYTWVIDPIDGTDNFTKGKVEFSISIGLMYENKFIAAMVYFPKIFECYVAYKDEGIYLNNKLINYEKHKKLPNVIILCSKTFEQNREYFEAKGYKVEYYFCATYSMLKVLKQEVILYCTINTQIYDVGPMSFILNQFGIKSFNKNMRTISFKPNLSTIKFIVSTNNRILANDLIDNSI